MFMIIGASVIAFLLLWWTIFYSGRYYHYVSEPVGKRISLHVGIHVTLVVGVNACLWIEQPLLFSSILAGCAGLGAGWFVGIPFSVKSILSGIMGGIGTGVSFYISMSMWMDQFNWLSFLLIGTSVIFSGSSLFQVLKSIPSFEKVLVKMWVQHPFLIAPILITVFWLYNFIEKYFPQADPTRK